MDVVETSFCFAIFLVIADVESVRPNEKLSTTERESGCLSFEGESGTTAP